MGQSSFVSAGGRLLQFMVGWRWVYGGLKIWYLVRRRKHSPKY